MSVSWSVTIVTCPLRGLCPGGNSLLVTYALMLSVGEGSDKRQGEKVGGAFGRTRWPDRFFLLGRGVTQGLCTVGYTSHREEVAWRGGPIPYMPGLRPG